MISILLSGKVGIIGCFVFRYGMPNDSNGNQNFDEDAIISSL